MKVLLFIQWLYQLVWNVTPMFFCQEIICVTVGTINRIVMDNHSWCYSACSYCYKKTDVETTAFTRACDKYNDQLVLRLLHSCFIVVIFIYYFFYTLMYIGMYRLEVMVKYKEESTNFLPQDRECTELIGQSANEVNKLKIEVPNQIIIRWFLTFE